MTRSQILVLEAGPELDALIAEKVMGFPGPTGYWGPNKPKGTHLDYDFFGMDQDASQAAYMLHWGRKGTIGLCRWKEGWGPLCVDEYSTDISAAWEVVEKIRVGRDIHIESGLYEGEERWSVSTCYEVGEWKGWISADKPELAICRAALLSVMESNPPESPDSCEGK